MVIIEAGKMPAGAGETPALPGAKRRFAPSFHTLSGVSSRGCRRRLAWIASIPAPLTICALIACALALCPAPARAQFSKAPKDDPGLDILSEIEGKKGDDLEGLRLSHLALIESWQGVEPLIAAQKVAGAQFRWKMAQGYATPLVREPISTLIDVPADGEYRLYVREWIMQTTPLPLALTLQPLRASGTAAAVTYEPQGAALTHKFGEVRMLPKSMGHEQEAKLPIRFESEVQLNTFPTPAMFVWEYWDVKLTKGPHRIELQSDRTDNRVSAVFLTQSKTFRPSFSELKTDNTLGGVSCRYRWLGKGTAASLATGITYHWRGRHPLGSTEPLWYDHLAPVPKVAPNQWTPFVDVREQVVPGGGPWATWRPALSGVGEGTLEVQFAWQPHPAAVLRTLETAVSGGKAMFRVPNGRFGFTAPADKPVWGVWDPQVLPGIAGEESLVERYFTWAEEAAQTLGLQPDHPKPKLVHILANCRTGPPHMARGAEMLAKLGINWIPDASPALVQKLGLYDDSSARKVKMGDEIGTHTAADSINEDAALRDGFHAFLRAQAALEGLPVAEFLGTEDLRSIEAIDKLPENAGRFERRVYYCAQRYAHLATIPTYARGLKAIEREKPGAIVYNNYSPHPVFLTGRDMNGSDWFLLPRAGAQTLGWAEDWATGGSWGLGTPMGECTTFYAALVDCAVRTRRYPAGFYVGANCGFAAQKIFSCVSQGISILHLYDWGPIDAWAEGSNSWSEMQGQYLSIMQGTYAIGPADEIIARGTREPRRTAILYNRSHEIMSGSKLWMNRDWMWTFLGLRNAQVPVDVVIEEDLNEKALAQYNVLYVSGLNLERRHVHALRAWVEQGGLLIGSGGCAMYDAYGDKSPATEELFGASQRFATAEGGLSRERARFHQSELFPEVELPTASAGNQPFVLTPTQATVAAKYDGGEVAATIHELGKGRAVLLGVTPGEMYRAAGGAKGPARAWLAAPVLRQLGRPRAEFDCPESEVTVFDHPSGTAVLIGLYTTTPADLPARAGHLSVATERKVHEVTSALHGPLKWEMRDGRVEIETPPPAKFAVDTVILR
ncbi:MAG TPA: hypothetical protein VGO11_24680 [Chthoniobacteraceae bacterium]|nr:hypothetical protein [Chthoniobacteraceae bacterium]